MFCVFSYSGNRPRVCEVRTQLLFLEPRDHNGGAQMCEKKTNRRRQTRELLSLRLGCYPDTRPRVETVEGGTTVLTLVLCLDGAPTLDKRKPASQNSHGYHAGYLKANVGGPRERRTASVRGNGGISSACNSHPLPYSVQHTGCPAGQQQLVSRARMCNPVRISASQQLAGPRFCLSASISFPYAVHTCRCDFSRSPTT